MTAGWTLLREGETTPKVRPTFYLKVPSGDLDRGLGTGTVEAGPGFSVSKWLGNVQLFGEGAYIFQNSKSDYPGRNYVSYLGGAGIQATDRLVCLRAGQRLVCALRRRGGPGRGTAES